MDLAQEIGSLDSLSLHGLREFVQKYRNNESVVLEGQPTAETLAVYSNVLRSNVIQTFGNNKEGFELLETLFHTFAGISCLVSRLQVCQPTETAVVIDIISAICTDKELVKKFMCFHQSKPLFFGSRLLNMVASKLSTQSAQENGLFTLTNYSKWLANQMVDGEICNSQYLDGALKLGAPKEFVHEFMSKNLKSFSANFQGLFPAQKIFALKHVYASLSPDLETCAYQLMIIAPEMHLAFQETVRSNSPVVQIRALVLYARHSNNLKLLIDIALKFWAENHQISLIKQQTVSQVLISCCTSLSTDEEALQYSSSEHFLQGVSNRLESADQHIRKLGTLVAEIFVKRGGKELNFEEVYTDYDWWVGVDPMPEMERAEKSMETKETEGNKTNELQAILDYTPPAATESGDSDDEDFDSDDDEHTPVPPPFYIKDLVNYLVKDEYGEVKAALTYGPELVLRKASFGTEVRQYAEELLRATCSLADKHNIPQFYERRQSLMNAVLIADPVQAKTVVNMFSTGDWSLSQRLGLLAALAGSASVLSGNDSSIIKLDNAETERLEASRKLPLAQHLLFQGPQGHQGIDSGVNKRIEGVNSSLELAVKNAGSFSKVCNSFFFPLLNSPPKAGETSYETLVYSQWLRTLGAILFASYPTNYMPQMSGDLWNLALDLLQKPVPDLVRESACLCVMAVTSVAGAVIMRDFPADIGKCHDSILQFCEYTQDDRIRAIALQAASDVGRLGASMEQKLLNFSV